LLHLLANSLISISVAITVEMNKNHQSFSALCTSLCVASLTKFSTWTTWCQH